jgi:adenine-specific DNA-methyltransferase
MNKQDLIHKIKQLDGITQDERAYLIELVNTKKKYGLVWEDKPEDVEELLRTQLPVLREVVEKRILANDLPKEEKLPESKQPTLFDESINQENQINQSSDNIAPNHILIEGDNLHALTALTFTHEGKIDVMYFDPPYNTGNKDFKYNDSFVDREDSYRHSKWLSFMDKRLRIAKRLLSENGVIFISIDDNEQAQLKMLCDDIFGGELHIANFIWKSRQIIDSRNQTFASIDHEYIVSYGKSSFSILRGKKSSKEKYSNPDNDVRGPWMSNSILGLADAENRPNLHYILIDPETGFEYPCPPSTGWRYSQETVANKIAEKRIVFPKKKDGRPREKKFLSELNSEYTGFSSILPEEVGYTMNGTRELREIFDGAVFGFPKPTTLIKQIIQQSIPLNSIILDIFAGSGTTLHATMQMNSEDGGNRKCILVTNNENNICEEVTYERNRRVIQGYTNSKGERVQGLTNNNLRYFKSEFVGREPNLKNKRELTRLATELLCIKEDCYTENCLNQDDNELKDFQDERVSLECIKKALKHDIRLFSENGKNMLVVYNDEMIEEAVALIKFLLKKSCSSFNPANQGYDIYKVYVFSPGQYPYTEDFEEVLPYITLCALPDAIYKAYMNILPKRNKQSSLQLEDEIDENQPEPNN